MGYLTDFDGKGFVDIARGDLDLGALESEADKQEQEAAAKDKQGLVERLKTVLGDDVAEVRVSHRLTDSPAVLAIGEQDLGLQMRQILEASGQKVPDSKPVLEIDLRISFGRRAPLSISKLGYKSDTTVGGSYAVHFVRFYCTS